ncbi:hypothetical protein SAMN06309944_2051 [Micrococcales bacterium KH10]|nr:hypothetical protein SAMN06309944_2051 [Micrococcales bacterium KH10]
MKKKKKYVLRVKGKLSIPKHVKRKQACKGNMIVTIQAKKKGKFAKIAKTKVKLKSNCQYKKKIVVKATKKVKRLNNAKKARVIVRFKGNQALAPVRIAYKVRLVN